MAKWQELCDELIDRLASGGDRQKAYRNADAEMIRRTTRGQGPDSDSAKPEAGVRVVCLMSRLGDRVGVHLGSL